MSTKLIIGLPNYEKVILEGKPSKKGKKWIKATNANIQLLFDGKNAIGAMPKTGKPKKQYGLSKQGIPDLRLLNTINQRRYLDMDTGMLNVFW